jgi:SAM-dependent methyltransferase
MGRRALTGFTKVARSWLVLCATGALRWYRPGTVAQADDPEVVRREYASELGLLTRSSTYADAQGVDADDELFAAVSQCRPQRVPEVGCGPGSFAQRVVKQLGCELRAVDASPRMVELARETAFACHAESSLVPSPPIGASHGLQRIGVNALLADLEPTGR